MFAPETKALSVIVPVVKGVAFVAVLPIVKSVPPPPDAVLISYAISFVFVLAASFGVNVTVYCLEVVTVAGLWLIEVEAVGAVSSRKTVKLGFPDEYNAPS